MRVSIVVTVIMLVPSLLMAHGTQCRIVEGVKMIEAAYHDGSPMAFCDVSVFSGDTLVTSGSTDKDGRFTLAADDARVLRVEIDDGMGHLASIEIGAEEVIETVGQKNRMMLTVTGVSVIFGLLGLFSIFRHRRR